MRELTIASDTSVNAQIVRIAPHYDEQARGALPTALLLKLCAGGDSFGPSEVDYYTRDYAGLADAPIPRCYDAHFSAERRAYHILMDDHSATHQARWDIDADAGIWLRGGRGAGCAARPLLGARAAGPDRRRASPASVSWAPTSGISALGWSP